MSFLFHISFTQVCLIVRWDQVIFWLDCRSQIWTYPQDCAIGYLYLHGDSHFLLRADQCGVLHCNVSRGAVGLAIRRRGKASNKLSVYRPISLTLILPPPPPSPIDFCVMYWYTWGVMTAVLDLVHLGLIPSSSEEWLIGGVAFLHSKLLLTFHH